MVSFFANPVVTDCNNSPGQLIDLFQQLIEVELVRTTYCS